MAFVVPVFTFTGQLLAGQAFGGALIGAAAGFVANVTLALAVNSVVANNTKPKDQGSLIDLALDASAPRRLVIGKRMTGGVLVDWYLAGSNNTKLYLPVYLSEGPCGQITRVFAGGREVWSTPLVHGVRTTIPDFRSGGDRLWLTYYDGRAGQTADATLVALGQGWTSNNTMEGCAYVVIECQWDSDNLRQPPQLTFEMEGAKLYDRRLDTTAGGSGSHRIDNPSTWAWSDNPMVALDHFLLGRYWNGRRTFGIGLSADEVPYDRFAAQANVCDEDVDLQAGGTQKRYRANGFMFANDDYANTITKLCIAMAARAADFGGRFGVIGVESRTPVLTIDDADLIADSVETYTPKRSWSDLVGAVEGRYQDPAQLYQPVDFPRVTDAAWDAEDGGEPKVLTLDLEFETNVERAQRLALLKARAERRQATLKGVYPLRAIELERGDWFVRTGAKWGEDGKTFEVVERILNTENFTVSIVAQEVDAADSAWDESTAQDGPPTPIASTDALSAVAAPSLTVTSNPIVGAASNTPAIKVAFTNPTDPRVISMFIEVVRDSDGLKVATVPVTIPDADEEVIIQNGIADGVDYTVQAKFLTPGLSSGWSDPEGVTTGSTYAVGEADSVDWPNVTNSLGTRPANNATVGARSGTNLYRTDGTTVLTQAEVRTAEGVAASIASQGGLATLNFTTLGTNVRLADGSTSATNALLVTSLGTAAAIASQGALATLGQVNLGASGRVYRDDGTTRLTDALAVTALGTAAAIAGQTAWATLTTATEQNLVSYPNGKGNSAAASTIGWGSSGGHAPASPWYMADYAPGGGRYFYEEWVSGYSSATARYHTISINVAPGTYTLSMRGSTSLTGVVFYVQAYNGVTWLASSGQAALVNSTRNSVTVVAPTGTTRVEIAIQIPAQNSSGAYRNLLAREIKLELGSTATAYLNERLDAEAGANVTETRTAAAIASQGGLATLSFVTIGTNLRRADGSTTATEALIVTSLGTASAITGQGWGATASESAASNAQLPLGDNLLINTDWARSTEGWVGGWDGNTGLSVSRGLAENLSSPFDQSGQVRTYYTFVSGTPAANTVADGLVNGTYGNLAALRRYAPRVVPGEKLHVSCYMGGHRCKGRLIAVFWDEDAVLVNDSNAWDGANDAYYFGEGDPANAQRIGGFVTVPAGAAYIQLIPRLVASGGAANPYLFYGWPMVAKVSAVQTTAPPYKTGQADRYSDYTAENTAAAIAGQGWGATASAADAANGRTGAFPQDFTFGTRDWFDSFGGDPATVADAGGTIVSETGEGKVYQVSATNYLQPKACIKVQPGRRYLVVVRVRQKTNPSSGTATAGLTTNPMDSAFAHSGSYTGIATAAPSGRSSSATLTVAGGWVELACVYTCPAAVDSAGVYFRPRLDLAPGTSGVQQVSRFIITDVTDGAVGRNLTDLLRADLSTSVTESAVVTSLGVASSVTSQGALCTLNYVQFNSTVRLQDGTTIVTDALVVTASGTAAAIASQGALATLNAVGTSQISSGAVTGADDDETDAGQNVGSSWVAVADCSLTTIDAASRALIMFSAYIESSTDGSLMEARIKRDSTVIWGPKSIAGDPPEFSETFEDEGLIEYRPMFNGMVSFFDTDVPGAAATYTYTVELRVAGSVTTPWVASYRRMFGMIFKR